ncbi:hypothetical protein BTI247_59630 (plasmid) [Bacillus thuringiensis Bt18247]|uniref:DDE domain-containing protein n=1 Tax=Bacillus thuringiensis Bt18247 TaxID=1423143 RepID=A0A9W3SZG4_BACTU|nr:hypothetical protein BTI247_59630 [Bacillus thuringiensis Bt18247]
MFCIHRKRFWYKNFKPLANTLSNLDILILLFLKGCVIRMKKETSFKWRHYQPDIILLTVRWYLRYNLSFRNLVEMMEERGLSLAHTTIMRWVYQYGPKLDKRIQRYLKQTNDSWRVDETYIKVKGQWMYLYRAVDSEGNIINFYLSKSINLQSDSLKKLCSLFILQNLVQSQLIKILLIQLLSQR